MTATETRAHVTWPVDPHEVDRPDSADRPLAGTRVLDLSALLPGPVATRALADLGADVLKVERVDGGDTMRGLMPDAFAVVNRNKRSVALDLKTAVGQKVVQDLATQADVVVEGFRPGVTTRLGCDESTLRALNPRLVYCSISGYGQKSARHAEPGHDINYLALGGALAPEMRAGEPNIVLPVADMLAAAHASTAICAALLRAARTGLGVFIDLAMTDCVVAGVSHLLNERFVGGPDTVLRHPAYGVFTASDGIRVAIGCTETPFYRLACERLGLNDLLGGDYDEFDHRRQHWAHIEARIADVIVTRDAAYWLTNLGDAGLPVTAVSTLDTVHADEDLLARGVVAEQDGRLHVAFPAEFDGLRPGLRTAAPELGAANGDLYGADAP